MVLLRYLNQTTELGKGLDYLLINVSFNIIKNDIRKSYTISLVRKYSKSTHLYNVVFIY